MCLRVLLITCILLNIIVQCSEASVIPCLPCEDSECNKPPEGRCIWGEARDSCGYRICSRGPGEDCGGPREVMGICGEGLMCKLDEKCHGCSIDTMQCYPDVDGEDLDY